MKQSLQLKIAQQLTMTPQLQQAIKLLQLSTLDLEKEVVEAIEANSMLEIKEDNLQEGISTNKNENYNELELHEGKDNINNEIPNELPVDTEWQDIYQDYYQSKKFSSQTHENLNIESIYTAAKTLRGHLQMQLELSSISEVDKIIGNSIIDGVDDSGYLSVSLNDIYESINEKYPINMDEVLTVLHKIQHFDPVGVASRDLRECLLIQINLLPQDIPLLAKTRTLIQNYLDLLASKNVSRLKSRLQVKDHELKQIITIIKGLCPKPGDLINTKVSDIVTPDIVVVKEQDKWVVKLNPTLANKLRINPSYAAIVKKSNTSRENKFLQDQLNEAKWFLKSIKNRNDTLLRVATCIVEKQRDFLEHGVLKIKPLILQDIALELGLHESTISRVTTEKYIFTTFGVYELKYFFSSCISNNNGDKCSSKVICALIKKLIENEPENKPLSDLQIVKLLKKEEINVARRTVAKYRDSMKILSSSKRKKLLV